MTGSTPTAKMRPFDASLFADVVRGKKFEDFASGEQFEHHWGRTITESDVITFSTATCNWLPMYLNVEFARAHGHDGLVVPPLLLLCIAVGLSVEDLSEAGGVFLGIEECEFSGAVHVGDTVRASSTVLSARPSGSRPNTGIVTWLTEVHDQADRRVLHYTRSNIVARRGTKAAL